MRERIIGVETEYSLSHIPKPDGATISSSELSSRTISTATRMLGLAAPNGGLFWRNGGKAYVDVGHLEYASPECRGVHEAVVYDKAADHIVASAAAAVESEADSSLELGSIFAAKNNVDAHGNSFGSHENYLVQRSTSVISDPAEFFHYLARVLVPFLVSRTILCGSGHIKNGFHISQRAHFINAVASHDTRSPRPILNTRDEPHSDPNSYRRLHLILGDANMADWATFLKLGTTSLVLSMAEEVFLDGLPELLSPVTALRAISADPSLKTSVPLASGRNATALEIQQYYLDAARAFFDRPTEEEAQILERWSQVLSELARDPRLAVGKLDWVTKKSLLEGYGGDSEDWANPSIRALDFRYHSLRDDSIFSMLAGNGLMERIVTDDEVNRALLEPPAGTRARVRSAGIDYGYMPTDWTELQNPALDPVYLEDPFAWAPVEILLRMGMPPNEVFSVLSAGLQSASTDVIREALAGLAELAAHATSTLRFRIRALIARLAGHQDGQVRLAAIEAMGPAGRDNFAEPLRVAANDIDYRVRFAAVAALRGLR